MFNRVRAAAMIALRRFIADHEGSLMPMFVLSLIPVLALIGVAADYTRVSKVRTSLQVSLDAALLAGAKDGSTNWTSVALDSFNANVQANNASIATPTFATNANRVLYGQRQRYSPGNDCPTVGHLFYQCWSARDRHGDAKFQLLLCDGAQPNCASGSSA
jgi:Flp pilus assembly protein TadG